MIDNNTDSPWISLHDFSGLEGHRLWGFLNIKEEGLFPRTPFLARNGQSCGSPTNQELARRQRG